eukprot:CAMPEP_0205850186 /NCGR_PEP_ID=MMETSP1019-20131125/81108_1 /ASSEMBLY_ACC=CAM_ASM_000403 /TAXON_ID=46462 /ORGANISM="Anophryoides haemophila, Strain AH6" /LENGTH=43 /DNA_ID= /DNA_START= /DNA_END= /DNA_ORIENTATION=
MIILFMPDNGKTVSDKDLVSILEVMGHYMKVTGKKTSQMGKAD